MSLPHPPCNLFPTCSVPATPTPPGRLLSIPGFRGRRTFADGPALGAEAPGSQGRAAAAGGLGPSRRRSREPARGQVRAGADVSTRRDLPWARLRLAPASNSLPPESVEGLGGTGPLRDPLHLLS